MKKILPFVRRTLFSFLSAIGLNTPTRIVIFLSPLFIAASGYIVALGAKYLPFLPGVDKGSIANVFEVGAIAMAAKLLLWLHGAQKAEQPVIAAHLGEYTHPYTDVPMAFGSAFSEFEPGPSAAAAGPGQPPSHPAFHEIGEEPA